MESGRRQFLAIGTALFAWPLRDVRADTLDPAAAVIRAFCDALLEVMKRADHLGIRGRYDRLAPVIAQTFDLPAMTRIAVGPAWTTIPTEQQSALVDGFTRMTVATYANRFDGYSGERFEVSPTAEARATGRIVHTRLLPASGEPVVLDYLMRGTDPAWKVVDVYRNAALGIQLDPQIGRARSTDRKLAAAGGKADATRKLRKAGANRLIAHMLRR